MDEVRTILLVEDDDDLSALLRAVLEEEGAAVLVARDGGSAVAACEGAPRSAFPDRAYANLVFPDLVFMDLHIAGEPSGAELIAELRVRLPRACLVLLSGERDLRRRAAELGADGYLEKPFDIEALLRFVHPAVPPTEIHPPSA